MRVVLTGGSGLIGTALQPVLRESGHEVVQLVRRPPTSPSELRWDPWRGELDPAVLSGADALVCLSGVGVGDHRWTEPYKRQIIESRVDSVGTVSRALAAGAGPGILLAASAVGYYGDRGDDIVDESAAPGDDFLSGVCSQWEAAAQPARDAGLRVVTMRTGLVLSGSGGLLKRLKPIVASGVGGRLGSGRQFMPWISMLDELRAIEYLLTADVAGPVNLTAPRPARNSDFTKTLGAVLKRPTMLPTPAFALRLALGEFGVAALASQQAVPRALTESGFTFTHTDLEGALRWALAR
jgi:hypothetical protein